MHWLGDTEKWCLKVMFVEKFKNQLKVAWG